MAAGKSLLLRIIRRGVLIVPLTAAMLFIPAGTVKYWQGWAFLITSLVGPSLMVIYFYRRDPQLIERRLMSKETIPEQKFFQKAGGLVFYLSFLLPGFDFQFGWSRTYAAPVPVGVTALALGLILVCQLFVLWVVSVNRYAARVIQVEAGQTIASTGPYRFVRHPMYSAIVVMWLVAGPALGSLVAVPAFALFVPLIIFRLLNEEKILRRDLAGYVEYCQRTRYRLVPGVW